MLVCIWALKKIEIILVRIVFRFFGVYTCKLALKALWKIILVANSTD